MRVQRDRGTTGVRTGRLPDADGIRRLGLINWVVTRVAAKVIRAPKMHLFTTLGQHRRLFWAWFLFGSVVYAGRLPRPETEMVILRVAHLRDCEYELQQHRRIAARRGVPEGLQEKIFCWPDSDGLTPRQRALLAATDEFVEKRTIGRDVWDVLAEHLTPRQLIEFCLLAGQYDALATTISALEIPLDFPEVRP